MASDTVAEISRPDLEELITPPSASIANIRHLASYDWLERPTPTIAVPGVPPLWSAPKGPQRLKKDSGLVYIAQNAARHPDSPLEPLFRALYLENPSFDIRSTHVVTDRNNVRKLLSFVNPTLGKNERQTFTISIEIVKDTAIFCREETATYEYIAPHDFRGFGHEFEKAYTTGFLNGSTGHHRVISYHFGGMNLIVRHETDGYLGDNTGVSSPTSEKPGGDVLSGMLGSLSLSPPPPTSNTLTVREEGWVVSRESTLEIKTRVSHRSLEISEVAPQLWASQTPKLVRAYHIKGIFQEPKVEDVSAQIKRWEQAHEADLRKLAALIRKLLDVVKECGGIATVRYDVLGDQLVVQKVDRKKMLPKDLYIKWDDVKGPKAVTIGGDEDLGPESVASPARGAGGTKGTFGNPNDTPYYEVINHGLEKGLRQFFRRMPTRLADYRLLCQTLESHAIDVLGGRTLREIMEDMRGAKSDWDAAARQKIHGCKNLARDSAFRLVYVFLQGKFGSDAGDKNRAYNAIEFVVSHSRIFKYRARKMVREAYRERFQISEKQRKHLDRWPLPSTGSEEEDLTTEEEYVYFDSDSSF